MAKKVVTKKSLGQNFLRSKLAINKFVLTLHPNIEEQVIEIGPGAGAITYELAKSFHHVLCVEKDDFLSRDLQDKIANQNISVVNKDILNVTHSDIFTILDKERVIKVCGSLPYNISKQIINFFLKSLAFARVGVFIIQREVALAYTSRLPNKEYLARIGDVYGSVKLVSNIKPGCFSPKPQVTSSIILFERIESCSNHYVYKESFLGFLRKLYMYKRKMIRNSFLHFAKNNSISCKNVTFPNCFQNNRIEEISTRNLYKFYLSICDKTSGL